MEGLSRLGFWVKGQMLRAQNKKMYKLVLTTKLPITMTIMKTMRHIAWPPPCSPTWSRSIPRTTLERQ